MEVESAPLWFCFGGGAEWFAGSVTEALTGGFYDILYDDGDSESGVAADMIRPRGDHLASSDPTGAPDTAHTTSAATPDETHEEEHEEVHEEVLVGK